MPLTTVSVPVNVVEPDTSTLPVNSCVSSKLSPNLVEPDEYIMEDELYVVISTSTEAVP